MIGELHNTILKENREIGRGCCFGSVRLADSSTRHKA
jgi:hypothetical protein